VAEPAESKLKEVLEAFDLKNPVVEVVRFGCGHINDTFCVHTQSTEDTCKYFILQRLSQEAFKQPKALMANIVGVTEHLHKKIEKAGGDVQREALSVIRTKQAEPYFTDDIGGVWRIFSFVTDTDCYQTAETKEIFEASAKAFGKFQYLLSDYPAQTLFETIPRFHDTEDRLRLLKEAIAKNPLGRVQYCQSEIDFVLAREKDCSVVLEAQRQGKLPLRVTHNDTKLNNVLFDKQTGKAICVIDLDTTMPGLAINDFGDSIRFGANHCEEDEADLSKVNFDLELFEVYTRGFLEGAAGSLTSDEIAYLPWGAKLMTLECGIRFLTDYLLGDTYFKIHYPNQNFNRCRTQFKLVADMENMWQQMEAIIQKFI
jgi:hypothetical protein